MPPHDVIVIGGFPATSGVTLYETASFSTHRVSRERKVERPIILSHFHK
jgi:hypothetical protein